MIAREVPVQDVLRVVLQSGTQNLEEVVVTAIGMKKQEKALGYAASTVKSEDLNAAKSGSVMSGLTGKVAGLNITSGGATGSSQKVIVRGISSFSANQPLYVVDGVPIMNDFQGEDSFSNSVDFGNQANDINPEDVESVTVLKGASATALYGSRAANGVIMVTTKRAGAERLSVTYDGSFMGSSVLRVPQTQDRFGQGWGSFGPMENGSWGPVLDGRDHIWGPYSDGSEGLLTPLSKPFSYVKNNLRDFYETGFETNNNVSIRMGNDKLGFVASYGNVKSDGVLPGDADSYARNTISLRGNMKYKRFSAELNLNYVRKDITQAAAGQGDDGATMFSEILQHAVDVDISSMKDYTNPYFNTDNFYTAYAENPYWVLDHNRNKYQDDRVYGKIELAFEIMKGLKAVGRLGGDFTNATQKRWNEKVTFASGSWSELGGKKQQPGTYTERRDKVEQIDATAFLNADYKIGEDIALNGMIGWNLNQQTSSYLKSYLYGLEQPGWFNLANGVDKPMTTTYSDRRRLVGLFAQGEFGYKNFWFVNASIRNDWSSTFKGTNTGSFFYPSIGLSGIITDIFRCSTDIMPYMKVRISYSEVGNSPDVFLAIPTYALVDGVPVTQSRRPNPNLKPERTKSWEAGFNFVFFKNRLRLDGSIYQSRTYNQFFERTLSSTTGYKSEVVNGGRVDNKGIELSLRFEDKWGNFGWSSYLTYSLNRNKVVELLRNYEDPYTHELTSLDRIDMGGTSMYKMILTEGGSIGDIYVNTLRTDEHGAIYVHPSDQVVVTQPDEFVKAGNSAPKYNLGWGNTFSYKGLSLGFLFTARVGGVVVSQTQATMDAYGSSKATAIARDNGGAIVNGRPIGAEDYYTKIGGAGAQGGIGSMYTYSATNVRLAELSLGYDIPINKYVDWIKGLNVSFIGKNLFFLYRKAPFDPELTASTGTYFQGIDMFMSPSLRNLGFSVKVNF